MGYLFGQYRRLSGHFQGNFTGPKIFWSGSSFRTEATGYGLVKWCLNISCEQKLLYIMLLATIILSQLTLFAAYVN
jgi:glutamate dehydrogenase/leucine dehydrogenase